MTAGGADYLDRLAAFAEATRWSDLAPGARDAARRVLLDTLGAILAGSALPENAGLARLAARHAPGGSASLLGHPLRTDTYRAALVNGTAGVALEVDEGNRWGGGHPAIHVLPAALAVAEERGLAGSRLLEALVVGYEVGSRLGGATVPRPNLHSHGTWGVISTAAAVARLAEAPADEIRAVISLAASMSPANTWTPALDGATIRNAYPGRAALEGLLAVDYHRCGFTGLADGPADVYGTLLAERFEPEAVVAGLGAEPLRIERNYVKLHACCRFTHFALDAVCALRACHGLRAADVAGVEVTTIPFGLRMADPAPRSPLAARFSIPWAVAAALVLGRTDPPAFEEAALADPRIRDLAGRVKVGADPDMAPRRSDYPVARVRVTLGDGRTLEAETGVVRGDAEDPIGEDELVAKFLALAAPVLGERRAQEAVAAVAGVDRLADVRDLTALLRPA